MGGRGGGQGGGQWREGVVVMVGLGGWVDVEGAAVGRGWGDRSGWGGERRREGARVFLVVVDAVGRSGVRRWMRAGLLEHAERAVAVHAQCGCDPLRSRRGGAHDAGAQQDSAHARSHLPQLRTATGGSRCEHGREVTVTCDAAVCGADESGAALNDYFGSMPKVPRRPISCVLFSLKFDPQIPPLLSPRSHLSPPRRPLRVPSAASTRSHRRMASALSSLLCAHPCFPDDCLPDALPPPPLSPTPMTTPSPPC